MALITIQNLSGKTIEADPAKSLLKHFQDNRIDWMHSCGGKGRCTTCKVVVVDGMDKFSAVTPAELKYRALNALGPTERLSCQARPLGDVTVRAPEEFKLPHITYSE